MGPVSRTRKQQTLFEYVPQNLTQPLVDYSLSPYRLFSFYIVVLSYSLLFQ